MKIVLIGIQGSGKSTQGNLLSEKLGLPYLATGDIFRKLAKEESKLARYIRDMLAKGHLIPDEETIPIVQAYLARPEYQAGYILDGFPRTVNQAQGFAEPIDKVIYLKVSDKEAKSRLVLRIKKEARTDDSKEAIDKRISLFHTMTEPILAFYRQRALLLEVDGERTIEEIHADIVSKIQNG